MTTYDLVFEGGGTKGLAFVGALQEFEARGFVFDRLLGTSTGAITSVLLAAGYTAQELLSVLDERIDEQPVFASFLAAPRPVGMEEARQLLRDLNLPFIPTRIQEEWREQIVQGLLDQAFFQHVLSLDERGGWFAADRILEWLALKLDNHSGQAQQFSHMNLAQFYQATGRDVSLVASDTTEQRMLVLNHRTAPQCLLTWAVRMSMSLPLIWQEVEWQAEWGPYRGKDMTGHIVVDGGLLSNFPIELLISNMPHITAVMGPKGNTSVLGFLIDESLPVPQAPPASTWPPNALAAEALRSFQLGSLRTIQRIRRLIDTATKAHDKIVMETNECLVVRLPAQGYSVTEFDMSEARRDALIDAAREATRAYFDRRLTAPLRDDRERDREREVESKFARHAADQVATHMLES